jgi:heme-degrading monooxygenase HmoA
MDDQCQLMRRETTMRRISSDPSAVTQVDFTRASTDDTEAEALVRKLRHGEDEAAGRPGLLSSSLHVSDETVIVWRQWADDASWRASGGDESRPAGGGRVERLGPRDIATYELAYAHARDGGPFSIEPGSGLATLIDLEVTDPSRQRNILEFNTANSRAFSAHPGLRATAVFRGRDGTRIATYSQWETVGDWIAAVKTAAGGRIPGLEAAQTVQDVNAVLQEASRAMGARPEYHAYQVVSVTGP